MQRALIVLSGAIMTTGAAVFYAHWEQIAAYNVRRRSGVGRQVNFSIDGDGTRL
jgi:hypothetical protein